MAKSPGDTRLELLQGTLDMLILRTLQWGPQHGHGIGQTIRQQSDDLLKVETGSLYPALHRLVKRGWLQAEWGLSQANQRAKFYQLTPEGRKQLVREESRWTQLVNAIGLVMKPSRRIFFFSSRRRHTRSLCDWSSDVCSSDLCCGSTGRLCPGSPAATADRR